MPVRRSSIEKLLFQFFPLLLLMLFVASTAYGADAAQAPTWRIRFKEAAIVNGPSVKLGEIATPAGDISKEQWDELAARELWVSPPEGGKAVHMTRPRLQEAVMRTMKDLAPYCLFPPSLALQRGGALLSKEDIRNLVQKEVTPHLASLPGEAELSDYRLPQHIFLEHAGQKVVLEQLRSVSPGRLSLRLQVRELDNSIKQRLTGSVLVNCWANVPCASTVMNRDDVLEHTKITFKRVNLGKLRGEVWDGKGGPWKVTRPMGNGQVIYQSDVAPVPTVRKGARVNLLFEGKTIRLTTYAEALADGGAGETILVRNLQSRKEVLALVRDAETVVITNR